MGSVKIRNILLVVVVLVVAAVGVSLVALSRSAEWTTQSNEALVEFEAGLGANQKLYKQEARAHFELALKLDPDFVVAKIRIADSCRHEDEERSKKLLAEVFESDLSRLTPREVFMVERLTLLTNNEFDEAARQLDEYLEIHPNDPYVLHTQALRAWQQVDLQEAESLNKRLLEIDPNWVLAYNQLGYITMMQGRFAEAEEYFTSYRFIAPDQANPHDSLGELYILLGKYEQAEESLERALANKPDFMAAFEHLAMVDALRNDWEGATRRLERGVQTGAISAEYTTGARCGLDFWRLVQDRDWQAVMKLAEEECNPEKTSDIGSGIFLHKAACRLGDWELAETIEAGIRKSIDEAEESKRARTFDLLSPILHHLVGVRLSLQDNPTNAIEELKQADEKLSYLNAGLGIFKLSNRMALAHSLMISGHEAEAHALVAEVKAVNPRLAQQFEENLMADSAL
ncbi:MAG: tetratricopeptide repeat protein [Thermoanaerobaculales bacterium]|nr:tetratricopeptide repeat protein [Thermoanaerobaculales bacterium]